MWVHKGLTRTLHYLFISIAIFFPDCCQVIQIDLLLLNYLHSCFMMRKSQFKHLLLYQEHLCWKIFYLKCASAALKIFLHNQKDRQGSFPHINQESAKNITLCLLVE